MEVVFQMQNSIQTFLVVVGSVVAASWLAMPTETAAQGRWTNNTEVSWISADHENHLISALVKEPGRGPDVRRLRTDRPATFRFNLDSTAGDKTMVMIDGEEGDLADIPENATVHFHWKPIGNDRAAYGMFVSKIVYFTKEKLAERKASTE